MKGLGEQRGKTMPRTSIHVSSPCSTEVAHPLVHKATRNAIWIRAEKININTDRAAYQREANETVLSLGFIPSKSTRKAWEFRPASLSAWDAKAY